jgi:hypothetical protein
VRNERAIAFEGAAPAVGAEKAATWIPVGLFCAAFLAELWAILSLNGGRMTYALDDAYIHLALAENIARGHYGINMGEYSAPASSILWPFLIAPFSRLAAGEYVPLAVNLLASLATVVTYGKVVSSAFYGWQRPKRAFVTALVVTLLIPATNLMGLLFTGMEHSLQVLAAALLVLGTIREQQTGRVPWWLALAVACGPLVRYENLALSVPVLLYLAWRRHYGAAAVCAALVGATLGAFSLFLYSMDLGLLPSSVLAKSAAVSSGGRLGAVLANLQANLLGRQGVLMGLLLLLLLFAFASPRFSREERGLAGWTSLAVVLHLLVGRFGWFNRYEIYMWTPSLLALLYVYRDVFVRIAEREALYKTAFFACAFAALAAWPYARVLVEIPGGSNNIYEQQYQMHRFVADYYRAPVAVNDLGWVSYRNDAYVLDLWGLGSKRALTLRSQQGAGNWMDELAREEGVELAILYENWFGALPENWVPVADLYLGGELVTVDQGRVTFFALDAGEASGVRTLLLEFKETLPEGVRLVLRDEATAE